MVSGRSSLILLAISYPLVSAFVYKTTVCPGYKFLADEAIASLNRVATAAECGSEVFRSGTGYGAMEGFAQYDFGNGGDLTTCDLATVGSSSPAIQASPFHECGQIWTEFNAPPSFSQTGSCFTCLSNGCYDPECKYFTASGDCLTSCNLPNTIGSNGRTCTVLVVGDPSPPLVTASTPTASMAYRRWLSPSQ